MMLILVLFIMLMITVMYIDHKKNKDDDRGNLEISRRRLVDIGDMFTENKDGDNNIPRNHNLRHHRLIHRHNLSHHSLNRTSMQQKISELYTIISDLDKAVDALTLNHEPAVNILEGRSFLHHPVMQHVPRRSWVLQKDFITELNGLKVPASYDCDNFNNGQHWGNHFYFYEVPTRWYACYLHEAAIKSGIMMTIPTLPYVDDEYAEHVSVFQSVFRANPEHGFVMAELGARWGTWGSRAIKFLELVNNMNYSLFLVEANENNCGGVSEVMKKNNIEYTLDCNKASAESFNKWAKSKSHIDLIDIDIQGAELDFIQATFATIQSKVYRLIIGTHSPEIHLSLSKIFKDWILIHEVPHTSKECMVAGVTYLRGNYDVNSKERFKWEKLIELGCFHQTPFGKVTQFDGELILDNPKFVDSTKRFYMTDRDLRVNDLVNSSTSFPIRDINIVTFACEADGVIQLPAFLQSLIDNQSSNRISLTIFADALVYQKFEACMSSIKSIVIKIINIDDNDQNSILKNFQSNNYKCAKHKLNMITLLPKLDKILMLDLDALLTEDCSKLWSEWKKFPERVFLMIDEVDPKVIKGGFYNQHNDQYKDRFFPPNGVNSGVIMMDLFEMRRYGMTGEMMIRQNEGPTMLPDQDVINYWSFYHQNLVGIIDCRWNQRSDSHCTESFNTSKLGIIHGNRGVFHRDEYQNSSSMAIVRELYQNFTQRFNQHEKCHIFK